MPSAREREDSATEMNTAHFMLHGYALSARYSVARLGEARTTCASAAERGNARRRWRVTQPTERIMGKGATVR